MRILINASNLTVGGGVQVADSICKELFRFTTHQFVVVLPSVLQQCENDIKSHPNVKFISYTQQPTLRAAIMERDTFLDTLVEKEHIDAVLSIFGFTKWRPKCFHLCGFARPHWVLKDSPFWNYCSLTERIKVFVKRKMKMYLFRKSADSFYTENEYISTLLRKEFRNKRIYTVTNNYNQVFDRLDLWDKSVVLPGFDGITILTISVNYPHKNLSIIVPTIHHLKKNYPSFHFRFVLTISEEQYLNVCDEDKEHLIFLGQVKIEQCPHLYEQSDIMLLPTLLECFSASYAEAMRMKVPIITTDLNFAHSICGDAAMFYEATSANALGDAIHYLYGHEDLRNKLVEQGNYQLNTFDMAEERAAKLITILENEAQKRNNAKG